MDYVWHQHQQAAAVAAAKTPGFAFPPYALPWLAKRGPVLFPGKTFVNLFSTDALDFDGILKIYGLLKMDGTSPWKVHCNVSRCGGN